MLIDNSNPLLALKPLGFMMLVCLGFVSLIGSGGGGGGGDNPTCSGIFDVVDAFGFTPVTNAPLDTPITSSSASIGGFCSTKDITISGDGEYSINGGPFTQLPGRIGPNSGLQVRIVSAPTFGTTRSARVAIGDNLFDPAASFTVTTAPGSPAAAPTVQINSPVDQQLVDAQGIQVTGQANDPDGIFSIEVNGVGATSTDGFATWQVEIPLRSGGNTITVASADTLLNRNPIAARIRIENLAVVLAAPVDLAIDAPNDRLLVVDSDLRALVEIDMTTSERTMISDDATPGNLTPFIDPRRIAVNATGNQSWVIDHGYADLVAVDLVTGSRSLLVDTVAPGTSESLEDALDIALDEISNHALLLVGGLNSAVNDTRIISVDLADGTRFILSDGSTPNADNPLGLTFSGMSEVFDNVGFRLLVMQRQNLLSVDPLTGDRSVFSGAGIEGAVDASLDPLNNRVIVLNRVNSTLNGVDLNNGNIQLLWNVFGGNPQRIAFDPLNNRTFILFLFQSDIFATDMVTGETSIAY